MCCGVLENVARVSNEEVFKNKVEEVKDTRDGEQSQERG